MALFKRKKKEESTRNWFIDIGKDNCDKLQQMVDKLPQSREHTNFTMNYTIELNKDEFKALKKFLKEEYSSVKALRNNEVFRVEYKDGDSLEVREHELLLLLGKLDNIIPMADKITEDTSILAARKYGLFGRK